jgi:transposase
MIPLATGVRVWIATGHTDMRRGMNSLALQVQEGLQRDPHAGDLYVFRGKRGDLIKVLWHDGLGMSLYAKRLALRQAQEWPVHLAVAGRRGGGNHSGTIRIPARRHRLAQSGADLAAAGGRLKARAAAF